MKVFKIVFTIYLFVVILIGVNSVQAGFITGEILPCKDDCTLCHLWQLASNVINFISFNLAIPIAALLFVAAGIIFLTSGGSEQKVGLAKSIFTNTAIGLLIIFCSWLLVDTLIKTLVTTSTESGVVVWSWNDFPIDCVIGEE